MLVRLNQALIYLKELEFEFGNLELQLNLNKIIISMKDISKMENIMDMGDILEILVWVVYMVSVFYYFKRHAYNLITVIPFVISPKKWRFYRFLWGGKMTTANKKILKNYFKKFI